MKNSDMDSMNQLMAELYKEASKLLGPNQAKELICISISNIISDFQDEGIEFTAVELDKRICTELSVLIEIAKKTKAA